MLQRLDSGKLKFAGGPDGGPSFAKRRAHGKKKQKAVAEFCMAPYYLAYVEPQPVCCV
jgi:hypothetical protein